jgi:hypothetical protein
MADQTATDKPIEIPAGILAARAALRKDLPNLLANRRCRGKMACYSSDGQIGIGNDYLALVRECVKRGIPDDAFIVERIEPGAGSDEEEEIDSFWV